jgi:hypothetical protein
MQQERTTMVRRPILGASLIAGGLFAMGFGALWNLANYQDQGPRCTIVACPQSTLNWYWFVADASASIVVLGSVAFVLGVWFMLRRHHA